MALVRTKAAYELIVQEAAAIGAGKFIESCLAQYLAVIFYAEMEEQVADIISTHLRRFTNSRIGQFLSKNMQNMIGRTPKSDIAKLLGQMGDDFKARFNEQVDERQVAIYSNIIQARHNVGHKHGSSIDISEISVAIDAADRILESLDRCFRDDEQA
jgi:RiboL-PSP-HEPN